MEVEKHTSVLSFLHQFEYKTPSSDESQNKIQVLKFSILANIRD